MSLASSGRSGSSAGFSWKFSVQPCETNLVPSLLVSRRRVTWALKLSLFLRTSPTPLGYQVEAKKLQLPGASDSQLSHGEVPN